MARWFGFLGRLVFMPSPEVLAHTVTFLFLETRLVEKAVGEVSFRET